MRDLPREKIFGKLNTLGYSTLESATVFCKHRGNPYVELEHWLAQILRAQDSDWHRVFAHFGVDISVVLRDVNASLQRLPQNATKISDLSLPLVRSVERAWVYASLLFDSRTIRTGHLLIGALNTPELAKPLLRISTALEAIGADALSEKFETIVAGSPEHGMRALDGSGEEVLAPGEGPGALPPAMLGGQEALNRFTVDLTQKARDGEMDPITGRDEEIRQIVDVLMRRRQNNPLLTGEAGVGKTAVVEGLAQRLARGDVPPGLRDVTLRLLDVGLLQAGASMKGEFEQRLKQLIEEVQMSPRPIVLFIDEVHTLVGAGGAAGTGDAANLLKPALARGTLRTIGATTWAEYKRHIEKDPALTRRFQVIQVPEPSEHNAVGMLRGVAGVLEKHHGVQVLDEAIVSAVRLSRRYIPARQLPDKAVSLLDTACARVAISQHGIPAALEDCRHRIEGLETTLAIIDREEAVGIDVSERRAQATAELDEQRAMAAVLEKRWNSEKSLVDRLLEVRGHLRAPPPPAAAETQAGTGDIAADNLDPGNAPAPAAAPIVPAADRAKLLDELAGLQDELHKLQGEQPLVSTNVDEDAVATVVADWTGIPVTRMVRNEIESLLHLGDTLSARIIGQRHAIDTIAKRIQTSRARLDNPGKPIGVFMLCGTSGVGKTETALALAEALYGGENNLITINMSEFQEKHTVSTLKGAPPGYVGYGEGGVLTEAVRRRPYSVVLLDEIEKAHSDVHEIFFQVFDKGVMEDAEGRRIDFRNTIILLTSNVGTELITGLCKDPDTMPSPEALAGALREPLLKTFPAALLGRLVVVPYYPLSDEIMGRIVRLQLERVVRRVRDNHAIPLTYDQSVVDLIVSRCTEAESGGRVIEAIITNTVLPRISLEFLERLASGRTLESIGLSATSGEFVYRFE